MPLPKLDQQKLRDALEKVGIEPGDGLLVHSALQLLGRPQGGLHMYWETLKDLIGDYGTLAVPAFNFAFARGQDFDPILTPSEGMGAFSEFIRQQPGALRTLHPMQSLAVLGRHAADLTGRDTASAFDDGSAFSRMLDLDFKLLLLGADIQAASMVHYCEQRAAVPYRYWKDFSGRIKTDMSWNSRSFRMFVRDMDLDPQLRLRPIQELLESRGQWNSQPLNFGKLAACRLQDFVTATDELLARDAWVLVKNRPEKVDR
jgi:aminoglycoside N3'-acetyltransferase